MVIRVRPTPSPALLKVPEATIAQLARRFLVDPFSASTGPDLSGLSAEGLDALARLAESLEVPAKELMESTGELRSRAVELLVDVLKRASLESARGKAAKESLGDAGLLPSGQYSIQFNDLLTQFEDLGERKVHILEVMQAPHSVQHVASENDEDNVEGQSLFARSISPPKSPEFLQLVIAHRKGSVLSFAGAWRIYSELVDWNSSKTLIDILSSSYQSMVLAFQLGIHSLNCSLSTKHLMYPQIFVRMPERRSEY